MQEMYSVVKEQIMYKRLQRAAERARQLDQSLLTARPQGQCTLTLNTHSQALTHGDTHVVAGRVNGHRSTAAAVTV